MSRESIRQALKNVVETVYAGPVFTSRTQDLSSETEYVNVYLVEGEFIRNMSGITGTEAQLAVKFCKQNATDDDLDIVIEQIDEAIVLSNSLAALLNRPLLERFEYEEDTADINGITYFYKVLF